jgi:predicted transcriptional regulator YdeE
LGIGDSSSTDKYHVVPNPNFNKSGTDSMFEFMLSPGINPKILNDEKSKNIIRFNLDDEDIQDFEDYYITNKLVEKTPDGMYKVIVNKITYAAKTYVKGTILKLDQA